MNNLLGPELARSIVDDRLRQAAKTRSAQPAPTVAVTRGRTRRRASVLLRLIRPGAAVPEQR
jgi:hypothetical protein